MRDEIATFFERLLPEALERFLEETLGEAIPRRGEGRRFRVLAAGRFSGHIAGDLLTYARNQEIDAALIMVERDVTRILYFQQGTVIGADSNVLFERLGRVLGRAGILEKDVARDLGEIEEQEGVAGAVARLSPDAAQWGLERRVWEIAAGLYFMPHAHYVLVDGEPDLGDLPRCKIPPMELAVEGLRRYDEWRNRSHGGSGEGEASAEPAPEALKPEEDGGDRPSPPEGEATDVADIEEIEEIAAAEDEVAGDDEASRPPPTKRSGAASLPPDTERLRKQISDLLRG